MTVVIDPETGVSVTYGIFDGRYRVDVDGAVLVDTGDYRFNSPDDAAFWALALITGETARDGESDATYRMHPGATSRMIEMLELELSDCEGVA